MTLILSGENGVALAIVHDGGNFGQNKIIFGYIRITLPKEIIEGLACRASRQRQASAHALMVTLPSTTLKSRWSSQPTLWRPRLGWRPFDDRVDPNGRRGRCKGNTQSTRRAMLASWAYPPAISPWCPPTPIYSPTVSPHISPSPSFAHSSQPTHHPDTDRRQPVNRNHRSVCAPSPPDP